MKWMYVNNDRIFLQLEKNNNTYHKSSVLYIKHFDLTFQSQMYSKNSITLLSMIFQRH